MKKLNVIDLFSGAGGFSEGFSQTNKYRFLAHVEWENPMVETLRVNLLKRWDSTENQAKKSVIEFDIQKNYELINGDWSKETRDLYEKYNHELVVNKGFKGVVGDRVLDFYVTKILMDRYGYTKSQLDDFDLEECDDEFVVDTYTNEGSLTDIKKKLVNKKMLAHRIDMLGFKEYLFMGNGDIQQHKENEESVKEDLFEAILGAIAIDSNWNPDELENSVSFMLNMDHYLNHGFTEDDDYVGLVQQWNQKEHGEVPDYDFQEKYNGGFIAYLILDRPRGRIRYQAEGDSKAEARANVAEVAYNDLDEHNELFTILDELPEELTLENSVNTLHELAQKGYVSMPEYDLPKDQVYDNDGNSKWQCTCTLRSHSIQETAYATSKKVAK